MKRKFFRTIARIEDGQVEGVAGITGEALEAALIDLCVIGPLVARTHDRESILPTLRKARALFVILALTDGQAASRRYLASLLWSRYDAGQALARLRDTLRTLRQALKDGLGGQEVMDVSAERVALRAGAVRVDAPAPATPLQGGSEIAADLDGLDPALDAWLLALRGRYRSLAAALQPPDGSARPAITPKRGSVIGVSLLSAIGPQTDDYLAYALAEEIATSLARIRGLVVVASSSVASTMAAGGHPREDLGLDFLLEGTLQHVRGRMRVTVKLVEAGTRVVCWTAHFEYDANDLFHVQQDVAALVAAGLEPELPLIAARKIVRADTSGDSAYELILRAIGRIHLLDRLSFMEAGELLNRAIDLEPGYSPAYSWLALWHVFLVGQGWARDPRASIARAGDVAEHAVMLDPNDARGLAIAGHVRAFLHRRLDEAIPLHERALAINPSLALAWHLSGVAQAYKGNLAEARHRIEQCRRLAPRDPHSFFADGAVIIVELLSRDHEQAATIGRRVTQLHPRFSAAYKPYLSALGHLGIEKEAALIYRRLLQLEPEFTVRSFRATSPFVLRDHTDHYAAGLTLAGVG